MFGFRFIVFWLTLYWETIRKIKCFSLFFLKFVFLINTLFAWDFASMGSYSFHPHAWFPKPCMKKQLNFIILKFHQYSFIHTCLASNTIFVEIFENYGFNEWCCNKRRENKHKSNAQDVNVVEIPIHLLG